MSAPDAAPLPRQGEVFFDVRGEARVLRLSWYADTGIAVFSIWQGGTCTGTFRLPIDELPRMVEILRRGPTGPAPADPGPPTEAAGAPVRSDRYAGPAYRPVPGRAETQEPAEEPTVPAEGGFSYGERKTYVSQQATRYEDTDGYDEYGDYAETPGGYAETPGGPLPVGRWSEDQDEHYSPGASRRPGPGRGPAGGRYGPDEEDHYLPGEAGPPVGYGAERGSHARPDEAGTLAGYPPEPGYPARESGSGPAGEEYGGYRPAPGHSGFEPERDDEYGPDHGYPAHLEPDEYAAAGRGYPAHPGRDDRYGPEDAYPAHPEAGGYGPDDAYPAHPEAGGYGPDDAYPAHSEAGRYGPDDAYPAHSEAGGYVPDHGYPAHSEPDGYAGAGRGYPAHPEPLDEGYGPDDRYDGFGPGEAGHGDHYDPDPLSDDHEAEQGYLSGPMTGVFGALEGGYDQETVGPGYHAGSGYGPPRGEVPPRGEAGEPGGYDPGPPSSYGPPRGEVPPRGEPREDSLEREYRPSRGRS